MKKGKDGYGENMFEEVFEGFHYQRLIWHRQTTEISLFGQVYQIRMGNLRTYEGRPGVNGVEVLLP
jgi:hypothetical protein